MEPEEQLVILRLRSPRIYRNPSPHLPVSRTSRLATSGVFGGAVTPRPRQHKCARAGLGLAHLSVPFVGSSASFRGTERPEVDRAGHVALDGSGQRPRGLD